MIKEKIASQWKIGWRNPHPPYQTYQFSYYLRSYQEAWSEFTDLLAGMQADRFVLLTDDQFPRTFVNEMAERIIPIAPCTYLNFKSTEQEKNLETVSMLGNAALRAGATRASGVIAFGGGQVGHIAGLLAGLLLRGAPFIQVPTTLLAMSNSALSLKQSVNSEIGKNHFGTFYAPNFVWSHLSFLQTLPPRETQSALCELIKNVVCIRPDLFDEIAATLRPDAVYTHSQLARFIALCIDTKSSVLADDAHEKHEALIFEYGHSIGHALEVAHPGLLPHGQAIGLGMLVEAQIAHQLGLLSATDVQAHYTLLRANGVSTTIPVNYDDETILKILRRENKRGYFQPTDGKYDMVLLKRLGEGHRTGKTLLTQVEEAEVLCALEHCRAA